MVYVDDEKFIARVFLKTILRFKIYPTQAREHLFANILRTIRAFVEHKKIAKVWMSKKSVLKNQ